MAKCFHCGAETPHAIRLPGIYSRLPAEKRGRMGFCLEHETDAFARRDAAIGTSRGDTGQIIAGTPQPQAGGGVHRKKHELNPTQGTLI
jgi:hypothetical protein